MKTSRDYSLDVREVKRGVFTFSEMINKPAIGFKCYADRVRGDEEDGTFANRADRFLHILIYGYTDTDGRGDDEESIYKLASDMEYFLYNDFTYTDDTFVGDFDYIQGNVVGYNLFILEIRIKYSSVTTDR